MQKIEHRSFSGELRAEGENVLLGVVVPYNTASQDRRPLHRDLAAGSDRRDRPRGPGERAAFTICCTSSTQGGWRSVFHRQRDRAESADRTTRLHRPGQTPPS